ncbi:hypothetical protein RVY79_17120, partial [Chromohalobacter sp. HP20-39]|nr:hypothetical protein [Chromohalobacter sp. HP20-39]
RKNWVERQVSFVVQFSQPVRGRQTLPARPGDKAPRVLLEFDLGPERTLEARVALSSVDEAGAERNLATAAGQGFDAVREAAEARGLRVFDATCPLVTKVHREAAIHFKRGREILLIGHSHHPEVVGTVGQLPPGAVQLIETAEDAQTFQPKNPDNLAFVTQTTLSIDDTAEIVAVLK